MRGNYLSFIENFILYRRELFLSVYSFPPLSQERFHVQRRSMYPWKAIVTPGSVFPGMIAVWRAGEVK